MGHFFYFISSNIFNGDIYEKNKRKIASIIIITSMIISIGINAYGYSGRTNSRGGHKDNQNKSGLGS